MPKGRFFRGGGAKHQEEVVGEGELEPDEVLGIDEERTGKGLVRALQGEFAVYMCKEREYRGREGGREGWREDQT
jgi:hypothetical protein